VLSYKLLPHAHGDGGIQTLLIVSIHGIGQGTDTLLDSMRT
jgi:hypothetical protein